jgi:hypothetical protein
MTLTDPALPVTTLRLVTTRPRSLDGVLRALDGLVGSPDPAVVFASLVRVCVPDVADAAVVRMTAVADPVEQLEPLEEVSRDTVCAPIAVSPVDGVPEVRGVLELHFADRHPGPAEAAVGRLVVDRAVALVQRERAAAATEKVRAQVDALGRALENSREIGVAMGIVMARHNLTADQSFDLLRRVSQRRNQKLRELALDVIATGQLDLPPGVAVRGGGGRDVPGPPPVRRRS